MPPLDDDPKDEESREFQNRLADGRITDEAYKADLEIINQDDSNEPQKVMNAERRLKDRIRAELGMAPRQTKKNLSLVQHAHNNNISPGYDLPSPDQAHEDGCRQDNGIQTILTPDLLERRMNAMLVKCKTWVQETGIDVLKAAFGFLEWFDTNDTSQPSLAPLILLPIEIEKKKTHKGSKFSVMSLGDATEYNTVLAEKLRIEYGLELPKFSEDMTPEDYFTEVAKLSPKGMKWRVRRQVAIGVFPSARMAMYHDLDTSTWNFADQPVIDNLFGRCDSAQGVTPYGDDYNIDDPDIEIKVPLTVMDSDSSQFSVMVDVADGKNIAVEGPPGTGKSQTIVNTIATMMANGKKILFVAEKTAALEVVRSRLEACGLGPFLLTLQAVRASKEQVIKSIGNRLDLGNEINPRNFDDILKDYKRTRDKLQKYIECVASVFGETNMTVYEILGNAISAHPQLAHLPEEVRRLPVPTPKKIDKQLIKQIVATCDLLESACLEAKIHKKYWGGIGNVNVDPFIADEILNAARRTGDEFKRAAEKRTALEKIGLNEDAEEAMLQIILDALVKLPDEINKIDLSLVGKLKSEKCIENTKKFFSDVDSIKKLKEEYDQLFVNTLDDNLAANLRKIEKICKEHNLKKLSNEDIHSEIKRVEEQKSQLALANEVCREIINQLTEAGNIKIRYLLVACEIAKAADRAVLALRCRDYEDPEVKEFLEKYRTEAVSLKERREKLSKIFNFDLCSEIQELEDNNAVLRKAGIFALFSPKYHAAKRFYKSLTNTGKWEGKASTTNLQQLIAWLKGKASYENDASVKSLLKAHFNGMDTNFDLFEKVLKYYEDVDNSLRGLSDLYLREFMCLAETSSIMSLPSIDNNHALHGFKDDTPNSLFAKIQELENKYNAWERSKSELENLLPLIKDPETFNISMLDEMPEKICAFLKRWRSLAEDADMRNVLGVYFWGIDTKITDIEESLKVAETAVLLGGDVGSIYLKAIEDDNVQNYCEIIKHVLHADADSGSELQNLAKLVQCEVEGLRRGLNRAAFSDHLYKASKDKQGLLSHSIVALYTKELSDLGYGEIIKALREDEEFYLGLSEKIKTLISQAMAREVYKEHSKILTNYNGIKLNKLRKQLAELDKKVLELSQKRLRVKLIREVNPSPGSRSGRRKEWTNMALLTHEVTKKGRYIPVRDLTSRAGEALLEIKPCWMVSPLAVAQYIPKGKIKFDLVIIDEASQMTPEDAIGALARGKQAMVVGDTNQLPPMDFFQKHFDEDDDEDKEVLTEESILEMSNAVFRPARRLKWHYRSRDARLIAFSNKYVYDSGLVIFPSPVENHPDMGVSFKKIPGLYSKGTNPIEAKAMIDAAVKFMSDYPSKSLGIVLLNQKQRDLMLEEMNYVLANDISVQRYVEQWEKNNDGLESFFIKNLENVQGDERDVIFIGTVYGPENEGAPVMQRFGPINGVTGKRRLNVLFTRAKERIVTFSSMTSSDIRTNEANVGVTMLKKWLEYSATGMLLVDDLTPQAREPDSMFEIFVTNQLKAMGCEVTPQVGVAGYFIDMGVKHPKWPHGFIMGVECDGAAYHSARSARDRDRLREGVLVDLGWSLHRIWSTDWFDDPVRQIQRLREAVEERLNELCQERRSPQLFF
ncbi:MAG: DUF4011 domain-containing protein [wastewater metagenome]|nr:DUF4011 domain-containing protein [Candidatus Loosdrechtia aerotolerans]